ncbi:hypothetical protein RYZ26_00675 [Terasakiella sp. A23]|uniref:hypothetical protein n=1 Tax=Terasakiella sp. FCG-A23 TaxID=3080561 RepID=UPI002953B569|nr:hypothetical protein [Terasakiella sp. A23]MDV7338088.1 hypothetical protein [Terasakiella sp. A23]
MVRFLALSFCVLSLTAFTAKADYKCPETIAVVQNNDISARTLFVVQGIYHDLGCETIFVQMPSKRGILDFNKQRSDGELMRQPGVESLYTTSFIKSAKPMFVLQKGIWGHPDAKIRNSHPTAYMFGIVWQDQYMTSRKGIPFKGEEKIADAYNRKIIGRFLTNNVTMAATDILANYTPQPIKLETVGKVDVHHYLHEDYRDFMDAFDRYIASFDPFRSFAAP